VVDDISIFHNKIGSAPSSTTDVPTYCPLNEAFWACSGAFSVKSQSHKQNDFRRIWLFTNDDSPNANMSVDQDHIIQASRDCSESGIELSLWHMNRANKPFDPSKFYTKLLTVGSSNDNTEGGDDAEDYIDSRMRGAGYDGFDMMMANVRRREHRKRKLGSHMMTLGREYGKDAVGAAAEVQIALQMYKTVSITKRPGHTWLFSGTNEPLKVFNSRIKLLR
jgi:ATP-dependent DNA helicase 2 subunit 1